MLICLLNHEEQDDGQQDMFPLEEIREYSGLGEQILAEESDLHDAEAGGCDQAGGSRAKSVKGALYIAVLLELLQKLADQNNNDNRRRNQADNRDDAARNTTDLIAEICRGVNADWAGCGLRDRDHICDIRGGDQPGTRREILQEGKCRQSAADRKGVQS